MTLLPAYGRDYRTVTEIEQALKADKDFLTADGAYTNLSDLRRMKVQKVIVRYSALRRVHSVSLDKI